MTKRDATVVVVPCFNESRRLPTERFLRFAHTHEDVSFLLVNDGSSDDTLRILERLELMLPGQCSVLNLTTNVGKAEAVRQGLRMALDSTVHPPPAYVAYWDADLATPLETLLDFRDVLRRSPAIQLVMGCRLPLLGRVIRRHWLRARLGQLFACLASFVLQAPVHDTQCGAKMFRVSAELPAMLAAPFSSRWIFDLELLMRLKQQRTPVCALRSAVFEYPLESWEEVAGSKVKGRDFVRAARELATIYYRYSSRPMVPEPMPSSPQPILPVPAAHHDPDQVPLAQPRRRSA